MLLYANWQLETQSGLEETGMNSWLSLGKKLVK